MHFCPRFCKNTFRKFMETIRSESCPANSSSFRTCHEAFHLGLDSHQQVLLPEQLDDYMSDRIHCGFSTSISEN